MKKSTKCLVALMAALAVAPNVAYLSQPSSELVSAVEQAQQQKLLSLGASLNPQQQEQTKNLLGAKDFSAANTLMVDGNTINQYLHDGSNASTTVYSSAYIEQQAAGYGVQVQIVTPQNITLVSATTYQNAAITSGAKDVLIRIATVSPVTGEGALAGVYALLAKSGVKVDEKAVKVAEKEIKVVEVVKKEDKLDDTKANQIISEIKKEVTNQQANQGVNVDTQVAQTIVNQVINNTTVNNNTTINNNTTNNNTTVNISDSTKEELVKLAEEYAKTEAAKSKDTIQQLEKSVDNSLNAPWKEVLNSLDETSAPSKEEILNAERKDYSDQAVYNPILPAMFKKFYERVQNGEPVYDIYSHTFILEKFLPDMKPEEKQALNQLRVYLYQYTNTLDKDRKEALGNDYTSVKQRWTAQLNAAEAVGNQAELKSLTDKFALATGYANEVYAYEFVQDGSKITAFPRVDLVTHVSTADHLFYDTATGQVSVGIEPNVTPVANGLFSFQNAYGVDVKPSADLTINLPKDFKIPGYNGDNQASSSNSQESQASVQNPAEASTAPANQDQNQPAPTQPGTESSEAGQPANNGQNP